MITFDSQYKHVIIDEFYGDIHITSSLDDQVHARIEGREDKLGQCLFDSHPGSLRIYSRIQGTSGTFNRRMNCHNGVYSMNGVVLDPSDKLQLTLEVPEDTSVHVEHVVLGNIRVDMTIGLELFTQHLGSIYSKYVDGLQLHVYGLTDVEIGFAVNGLELYLYGTAKATVRDVLSGDLTIKAFEMASCLVEIVRPSLGNKINIFSTTSNDVTIFAGKVSYLEVDGSGTGQINYGGSTESLRVGYLSKRTRIGHCLNIVENHSQPGCLLVANC